MLIAAQDILSYDDIIKNLYNKFRLVKNYHYRDILQQARLWVIEARHVKPDRDYVFSILNHYFSKLYTRLFRIAIDYKKSDDRQGLPSEQLIDLMLDTRIDLAVRIEYYTLFKQTINRLIEKAPNEYKQKMETFLSIFKNNSNNDEVSQEKNYPSFFKDAQEVSFSI